MKPCHEFFVFFESTVAVTELLTCCYGNIIYELCKSMFKSFFQFYVNLSVLYPPVLFEPKIQNTSSVFLQSCVDTNGFIIAIAGSNERHYCMQKHYFKKTNYITCGTQQVVLDVIKVQEVWSAISVLEESVIHIQEERTNFQHRFMYDYFLDKKVTTFVLIFLLKY